MSAGAPPPRPGDAPTLEGAPPPDLLPPDAPPPGPPRRRVWPPDRDLWPWLALLLVLVVGGVIAAILLSGNHKRHPRNPGTGTIVNTKPGTVLLPSVIGMQQAPASRKLEDLGLNVQTRRQTSREAAGIVLGQTPKPGTRMARGRLVGLAVSGGPPQAVVPNVVGLPVATASARLQATGLKATTKQAASPKRPGTVVAQTPAAGATLTRGGAVTLTVSKGPAKVSIPDVTGLPRAQAVQKVRAAGLTPNAVAVPSTQPAGTVVAQFPSAGQTAARGSSVRLNVAKGTSGGGGGGGGSGGNRNQRPTKPAKVRVPNVVGKQQPAAQRTLVKAGLRPRVAYVASQQPQGTVIAQSPAAGTTVTRKSRVRLKVSTGPSAPQQATVADVTGEDQATATADLQNAGFQVQTIDQQTTDASQDGIVLDQDPGGGSRAPVGATVTIVVGRYSSG